MPPIVRGAVLALLLAAACSDTCTESSCPSGTYCEGGACVSDCTVASDCASFACDGSSVCCSTEPFCDENGRCVREEIPLEQCTGEAPFPPDGWDDPVASGPTFVINAVAIAPATVGANVDGKCRNGVCLDNALAPLGDLANDQIRQGLLGGETLIGVEIAGLTTPFRGYDRSVTIKIYVLADADDPFFPANNFKVPPGHTTCCQFLVRSSRLDGNGQPTARIPARIVDYRIETTHAVNARVIPSACEPPTFVVDLFNASFTGVIDEGMFTLTAGVLAGAMPVGNLASNTNPYCRTVSPRCPVALADDLYSLVRSQGLQDPDIDVDGDGRECFFDRDGDGLVDLCCDGTGNPVCPSATASCPANTILPVDPDDPKSCVQSPRAQDAFSVAFSMSGIAAEIQGLR